MKGITVDVARRYIDRFGGQIQANGNNFNAPEYLTDKYGSRLAMIRKDFKTKKELDNRIKENNENSFGAVFVVFIGIIIVVAAFILGLS